MKKIAYIIMISGRKKVAKHKANKHLPESPEVREERLQKNAKLEATKHLLQSNLFAVHLHSGEIMPS